MLERIVCITFIQNNTGRNILENLHRVSIILKYTLFHLQGHIFLLQEHKVCQKTRNLMPARW